MKKIFALMGSVLLVGVATVYLLHPSHTSIPQLPTPQPGSHSSSHESKQPRTADSQPTSAHTAQASAKPKAAASMSTPTQPVAKPVDITSQDGTSYPVRRYKTLALPNDPGANQWWVTSTDLVAAWARGYGTHQTTVAVIDTGFALSHEEFEGRWATNTSEQGVAFSQGPSQLNCSDRGLPITASCNLIDDDLNTIVDDEIGTVWWENPSKLNCTDQGMILNKSCNRIDDDNNGYVDDARGWDFVNYDSSVQAGENNPNGESTMHGTMTSGVLGASGNNGKGIAGVNWNTKILPIQAIDDDGYGDTLTLARSILYAVSRNVDIISLSLGSVEPDEYVRQAIQYALTQDTIVVAATGNESCECITYPARYPETVSVGSHDSSGTPSEFSNYGEALDILAPGENMILPAWSPVYPTDAYIGGAYGTSFATPYVAGVLAQLKSLQPNATYGELVAALNESATHTGLSATAPWTKTLGYGNAHAGKATARVTTPSSTGRYQFTPIASSSPFDSFRVSGCFGSYPTVRLYELNKNGQVSYTISEAYRAAALASGWASQSLGYQCVSQPIDTPLFTRQINLFHEIRNDDSKR